MEYLFIPFIIVSIIIAIASAAKKMNVSSGDKSEWDPFKPASTQNKPSAPANPFAAYTQQPRPQMQNTYRVGQPVPHNPLTAAVPPVAKNNSEECHVDEACLDKNTVGQTGHSAFEGMHSESVPNRIALSVKTPVWKPSEIPMLSGSMNYVSTEGMAIGADEALKKPVTLFEVSEADDDTDNIALRRMGEHIVFGSVLADPAFKRSMVNKSR